MTDKMDKLYVEILEQTNQLLVNTAELRVQNSPGDCTVRLVAKSGSLQEIYFADLSANGDFFAVSSAGDGALALYSKPPSGSWGYVAAVGGGNVVTAGDEDKTLAVAAGASSSIDRTTLLFGTALTAARTVTLTTAQAHAGMVWRIVRQAAATGAFAIDVGGLKSLAAAGEWCEVTFNGSAWVLTAYGSL